VELFQSDASRVACQDTRTLLGEAVALLRCSEDQAGAGPSRRGGAMATELKFRQIVATAVVKTGMINVVEEKLYGLTDEGKVYMLTDEGWAPLMMHSTGKE